MLRRLEASRQVLIIQAKHRMCFLNDKLTGEERKACDQLFNRSLIGLRLLAYANQLSEPLYFRISVGSDSMIDNWIIEDLNRKVLEKVISDSRSRFRIFIARSKRREILYCYVYCSNKRRRKSNWIMGL